MKKIILSVAVAAMALTTTASALEDIKVNGQAKLWYETNDKGNGLFDQDQASGEVVFKLGMTGKQGDVGFGATIYQTSSMGLEGSLVTGTRTSTTNVQGNGDMFTGEAYVTAPAGANTTLKIGKQELNTPFVFTEKWNAMPITYNAAVAVYKADDLTVVGAYVGQTSGDTTDANADGSADAQWKSAGTPTAMINANGAYTLGGLYKTDGLGVNAWYYTLPGVADAFWVDASTKVAGLNVKAIVASMMPAASGSDATLGFAASVATKVSGVTVFAAASMVGEDGALPLANVGTNFKKTKLPTAGVYTDGVYVAQPGSTAIKVKAVTKIGSTKLIAQFVNNTNSNTWAAGKDKDTTEIDIIAIQKFGDFNVKGILMNRTFADSATATGTDGMHVRAIVSLNF